MPPANKDSVGYSGEVLDRTVFLEESVLLQGVTPKVSPHCSCWCLSTDVRNATPWFNIPHKVKLQTDPGFVKPGVNKKTPKTLNSDISWCSTLPLHCTVFCLPLHGTAGENQCRYRCLWLWQLNGFFSVQALSSLLSGWSRWREHGNDWMVDICHVH